MIKIRVGGEGGQNKVCVDKCPKKMRGHELENKSAERNETYPKRRRKETYFTEESIDF